MFAHCRSCNAKTVHVFGHCYVCLLASFKGDVAATEAVMKEAQKEQMELQLEAHPEISNEEDE